MSITHTKIGLDRIVSWKVFSDSPSRVVMPIAPWEVCVRTYVSGASRVASMVKGNITNQMTDAVESRASIINDYVASAEEYLTAFSMVQVCTGLGVQEYIFTVRQTFDIKIQQCIH